MKALNPSTGNLERVYVKALDSMPVGTEVDFDGQTSNIPVGWEEVTNPDSYSTNEVKTNKTWIDGKPLYRKVITISNTAISSSVTIDTNITNMENCARFDTIFKNNTEYQFNKMMGSQSTNLLFAYLSSNGATIAFKGNDSWAANTNRTWIFIIEYTKTTD